MTEATAITLRFPIIVKTGKWLLIGEMTSAGISTCSFFFAFHSIFNSTLLNDCNIFFNYRSWQTVSFPARVATFIRIVGTRNSVNEASVLSREMFEALSAVVKL